MRLRLNYTRLFNTISLLTPYLLVLLVTLAAAGVLQLLRNFLNPTTIALLFLLPVGLCTAVWGLGPGVTAAICAFLAFNYFFITPYYSLIVHRPEDLVVLIVFLGVAVVISQMVGRARRSLALATAHEREAVHLYELSTVMAGLNDSRAIAQVLAEHTLDTLRADRAEVFLESHSSNRPVHIRLTNPSTTGEPTDGRIMDGNTKPTLLVPLETARGLLGEIRLWRVDPPITQAEQRLLRAFASQGGLALERARLAEADRRARVLEESDRLKSSLLSSVSHELRSPLATIKASVTSLRSGAVNWDSEARDELLAAVEEETNHLNLLVGNLLSMSRIETGALNPQREWNALGEIVGSVVKRMRQETERHPIKIEFPEELPLVPVDYVQMEQVFTNLISNSAKYSPEDTPILIRAWQANDQEIQVQLINQGPPVPEEHLERIFDKFHRVTASDRVTGTGLGLSICKGIIEAHGGRIWAENLPGGFGFNFTLPLKWEGGPLRITVQ
jgi:two-component system, OmpR family, sensor histidine kinase KdpD